MTADQWGSVRRRFASLHRDGLFVMPNAFDAGSAKRLEEAGFSAIATTSSGHAATLGKQDQQVTREELVTHVQLLTSVVAVPVNVDAEQCFPDEVGGISETVHQLEQAGASGISIEDYEPSSSAVLAIQVAGERVREAVEAARGTGILITAREEGLLYETEPFDVVLQRLSVYRDAGADVLYAPGLIDDGQIRAVVDLGLPVNVLALPGTPPASRLKMLGVQRVSTGGALTWTAYQAAVDVAVALRDQ